MVATLLFIGIWWRVLLDNRVMIGGDVLYCCPPWNQTAGAHTPANALVADPIDQFLPWLRLVGESYASGRLPLWNPYALSGSPLLADDQSAPLSLFTLFALVPGGAWGLSLAMLLRLWVAGLGMYAFLRLLGSRGTGAVVGAIVAAGSSFLVIWMAWPQGQVAALIPGLFAAIELTLARRGTLGPLAIAAMVALQFLAGHAETSLYLGLAAPIYSIVRCLDGRPGRRIDLLRIVGGAAVGSLVAGVQLVPFLDMLRGSSLVTSRAAAGLGGVHLHLSALVSWLIPNIKGNPGIDGLSGRSPNYAEGTAFIGIAALLLTLPGLIALYRRLPTAALALAGIALVSALVVYGPLSPFVERIPLLNGSGSTRMTVLICFCFSALSGLGFDALRDWHLPRERWAIPALVLGIAGLIAYAAFALTFALLRQRAEGLFPAAPRGVIVFWTLAALVAGAAAATLVAASLWDRTKPVAMTCLAGLVLLESAMFAGPYQPQVRPAEVPPPSSVLSWMAAHAGGNAVAAAGFSLNPEVPSLYHLRDVRTYDLIESPRAEQFWSAADPNYQNVAFYTILNQPGADWLAAAGVGLVAVPGTTPLPGTQTVYQAEGMTVAQVPNPRPLAYAAPVVSAAASPDQAVLMLRPDPLGVVTAEGAGAVQAGAATVSVTSFEPGDISIDVNGDSTFVVVLQSYDLGWQALVDGRTAAIHPADVTFIGVQVPQGSHRLHLVYRPAAVTLGLAATGLGIALVLAMVGLATYRRSFSNLDRS